MVVFPEIEYKKEEQSLSNTNIAKNIVTILKDRGLIADNEFPEDYNLSDLENDIFAKIKDYKPENGNLEKIFHYIQIWGGKTGRNVYVGREKKYVFDWSKIEGYYKALVSICLEVNDNTEADLRKVLKAILDFNKNVDFMNLPFITKHTRFWLYRNLGKEKMLPIYDSIMAKGIMNECAVEEFDVIPYWKAMIEKAKEKEISLFALERQIFNHFNEEIKKRKESKDKSI